MCRRPAPPATGAEATVTPAAATAEPAAEPVLPENAVVNADREAPIRKKAEELKALRPEDVSRQEVGADAVVLVRGVVSGHGSGIIWGSDPYTLDSNLRTTAVHSGVLRDGELGLVRILVFAGGTEYPSVERNGVQPNTWGKYHSSYTIKKVQSQ